MQTRMRASGKSGTGTIRAGDTGLFSHEVDKRRSNVQYRAAVKNFELAARAFQKHNYAKAQEIFAKLASGEVHEVAERARVHLRLCEQKLSRPNSGPKTAEDYYTLGVGALNLGQLEQAIEHLSRAQKMGPKQEHIRYALAASHALKGSADAALEHLKAAIALRPENRVQARRDEDFRGLMADPRFRRLVYPEAS